MEFVTLRSPLDMLEASPALLAAEIITYGTFLLCAWHAWRNGAEHCLLLFVTLTAASAVDPFCLISPQIRNYYHDHASVLLADRRVAPWQFPLFADLAYLGAAAVWRLNLPLEVELAAVAVVNSYTFYPADQFFCKWLVYQWHDQDPLYADRNGAGTGQCVPCGSSMWVMTYGMCGSLVARLAARYYRRRYDALRRPTKGQRGEGAATKPPPMDKIAPAPAAPAASASPAAPAAPLPQAGGFRTFSRDWWTAAVVGVLVFLPGHIFPVFPLFYAPIGMLYGDAALAVRLFFTACFAYWVLNLGVFFSRPRRYSTDTERAGRRPIGTALLSAAALFWFGGLALVGVLIDPASVTSLSVHQPYGGKGVAESSLCAEMETYLFGLAERKKYQCEEDFRFWRLCGEEVEGSRPQPGDETYALCGTAGDETFWREYFGAIIIGAVLHLVCLAMASSPSLKHLERGAAGEKGQGGKGGTKAKKD